MYKSREIKIGDAVLGGDNPVLVQSMCNTDTLNTEASVAQCVRIIEAGAGMVRLTARNRKEAGNFRQIKEALLNKGYRTPLVADVHFSPTVALEAALHADKVRINPGNFADGNIEKPLLELIEVCRARDIALRIGVNHGSLSEGIMQKYGDSPTGMVESAMQYLRICRDEGFNDVVVSMKSSNTRIMVQSNRMLARTMSDEGMDYPIHLGVTEAGAGEDGRIRSAVGIGTLLKEGIGDTVRVSLTEAPEEEIPAARMILEAVSDLTRDSEDCFNMGPEAYIRRDSIKTGNIGGKQVPVVLGSLSAYKNGTNADYLVLGDHELLEDLPEDIPMIINAGHWQRENYPADRFYPLFTMEEFLLAKKASPGLNFVMTENADFSAAMEKLPRKGFPACLVYIMEACDKEWRSATDFPPSDRLSLPIIIRAAYKDTTKESFIIRSSTELGYAFIDGYADGLWIYDPFIEKQALVSTGYKILQACRSRMTETEYIACPSCGRTLFNIEERLLEVRRETSHLEKLKIAVMGCIVNGPGEMADADYGYVGAGPGKVSLYRGRQCIEKNIPENEALSRLIQIIQKFGDWENPTGNED